MKKILLIDDSALMRSVLSDIINRIEEYQVAYTAKNGVEGLKEIQAHQDIDVVVTDIDMPEMDGLTLLEYLNQKEILIPVVVISSMATKENTVKALELGAIDFVKKPTKPSKDRESSFSHMVASALSAAISSNLHTEHTGKKTVVPKKSGHIHSTKKTDTAKRLVALVCSTGGPKALQSVLPKLPKNLAAPVVMVQHMPKGFTAPLANRLNSLSELTVVEASEGEALKCGVVYIAKGGTHLVVENKGKTGTTAFDDQPPVRGLRPCGDILLGSLAELPYDEIVCVVLTGMGADGTKGIRELSEKKNVYVIAQDKESSTVYGMPRAVYEAGLCDCVCDLEDIAEEIIKKVGVL